MTVRLCSKKLHPMTKKNTRTLPVNGSTRMRIWCKACERIREHRRRAGKAADKGQTFRRLEIKGRKPQRYIYPDDYVEPEPAHVPQHKLPLEDRVKDHDVLRYYSEREAYRARRAKRDASGEASWTGTPYTHAKFRDFETAPSRDHEVRRLAT